ncbi:Hypothetical predicted protein, partial [Prunus dulcis]
SLYDLITRGRHGQQGRDPCDIENEELRRQVHQLTRQLCRFETQNHHDDDLSLGDDKNPFRAPHEDPGEEAVYEHAIQFNNTFNDINMKVDIMEFEGSIKPDEFINWLNTVERVFDYKEVPNHCMLKIMAIKLTKFASAWWKQLRERLGKARITLGTT